MKAHQSVPLQIFARIRASLLLLSTLCFILEAVGQPSTPRDSTRVTNGLVYAVVPSLLLGLPAVAQGIKDDLQSADIISKNGKLTAGSVDVPSPQRLRMMNGKSMQPVSSCVSAVSGDENWDGQFSANGLDNTVEAIAVSSTGEVYVGGSFVNAGTTPVNRIAKWNGSTWSALGSGVNSTIFAVAVNGADIYVAGRFTTAGGISANRIAKWNGSSWSALGSGVNNWIYALAVRGNEVYVGGDFTSAGGVSAMRIAKWDGSSWSALGTGISGGVMFKTVNAIGISGTDVFVGGDFTSAGGVSAKSIARWDGSTWSALGSGVDNWGIQAITVSVSDVVVGGWFSTAGGVPANAQFTLTWKCDRLHCKLINDLL